MELVLAAGRAHHLSYLAGGIIVLLLAPVWYFIFYPIIEYTTKKTGNPYKLSMIQKTLPVAFLVLLGIGLVIRGN